MDRPRHRKKVIGMVLDQPFPPDARVEREAVALIEAGYEVHLLCLHDEPDEPTEEAYRGIYIHRVDPNTVTYRLPLVKSRTRFPYRGLVKNLARAFWNIDTPWYTLIDRFIWRFRIDILHVHDLRLVSTALSVANRYNVRVVADLHENYPALMEMFKGKKDPRRGHRQRKKWETIEKYATWEADRVITVIEEARDRLVAKGIRPQKITVLPNTVDIGKFEAAPVDNGVVRQFKTSFLLTYVGHINGPHRGIHTVLEAVAMLKEEIPEIYFVAAGAVRDHYMAELRELINQHHLHNHVGFTGWLDETQFVTYIKAADICLCPHLANDHTDSTFPNKVYLYHLFGKPVITSSCIPLQRYIEDTSGGAIFQSGDAKSLADKIRQLYRDDAMRRHMGEVGRQAVQAHYNWQHTARELVGMYDAMS
jgi:glycosyltransferase involved in cell wall biosynthesis